VFDAFGTHARKYSAIGVGFGPELKLGSGLLEGDATDTRRCLYERHRFEQRRWSRLSRVQTEVHGKVLERLTSNDELLRYIETPAGRRFLESAPIPVDTASRQVSAPIGRILWSIQMGLVVAAAGVGLRFVSSGIDKEAAQPLHALGVVALCVGIGFVLSAVLSFILSRRLKLFEPPEAANG